LGSQVKPRGSKEMEIPQKLWQASGVEANLDQCSSYGKDLET